MKKLLRFLNDNILFALTLFLLVFIPLYPKLPLLDIKNTWVYIRAEDFIIVLVVALWAILLLRQKITLKTPLTLPILIFWAIGAVATIHGVLLVFPELSNVFPNVAFLSFLRRIEYMSLFFVAYAGMKDKQSLPQVIAVLVSTLFLVSLYGFGQKYLGFPAFLTMNEEFAKGIPVQLSSLSRVPSTFGGHYDLAAYLVLVIPILVSLVFGFKNWPIRLILIFAATLGFVLLFMTVSRVSFFVLLISLFIVLFFQKKKFAILSLPIAVVTIFIILSLTPALLGRFGNTVKEVNILVDVKTGEAIGSVKEVESKTFENKIIGRKYARSKNELEGAMKDKKEELKLASPSAIIPLSILPSRVVVIIPPDVSTGENLPQGTGYINLSLSPVTKRIGQVFFEKPHEVLLFDGDFLIKRVSAYDLSFTTRFQGEWPRAIAAFKRDILFGSGYSSISLAVDNSYLRMLGEIGLLGFTSFLAIFIAIGVYIKRILPEIDSPLVRSFIFGFIAGVIGLAFNAILIDVFEASKIAYLLWLLTGVTLGILSFYQRKEINLYKEFKNIVTSTFAVIVYLFIVTIVVFSPMIGNFFVGDDFTWFRWVMDRNNGIANSIFGYFTGSDGFFYRPGTKIYFLLMYKVFWLNQTVYHLVSILLHFGVTTLLFLLAKKVLRDFKLSVLAAFLFLILSGYSEAVFWVSSTGFLFNAMFALLSLLFFILWEEKKKTIYLIISLSAIVLGLMFHELGVITPLLIILYKFSFKKIYYLFFLPLLPYLILRYLAGSHWFSGDYSYNLLKLPLNVIGNTIGYLSLGFFGPLSLPFYQLLRNLSRGNMISAIIFSLGLLLVFILGIRIVLKRRIDKEDRRIIVFGTLFFAIALLPFLGLGNITSRYSYLASLGLILLFVFFIKKAYGYLYTNGREITLASITVIMAVFFLLQIIQIQKIHSDWYEAGKKANRFFISIDELYDDYWAKEPMKFYFVNVPIRVGEAWVFPVGLKDALWLIFRNPKIDVYQSLSVEQALETVNGSINEKVFEFDESGKVIEHKKILDAK